MFDGNKGQGYAQRQGTKPKIFTPSTNFTPTYCRHDLNDLEIKQKYVLFITSDKKVRYPSITELFVTYGKYHSRAALPRLTCHGHEILANNKAS
jgi:hypothetical protein